MKLMNWTSVRRRVRVGGVGRVGPVRAFRNHEYLRHNARRQEHLASLGIPVAGSSVLAVAAGTGDHSHYFLDRGCRTTITEAREENLRLLRKRYPSADVRRLDLEDPVTLPGAPFEVVYVPVTQPNHDEFPIDWTRRDRHGAVLARAVFVASRSHVESPLLATELPAEQRRHL